MVVFGPTARGLASGAAWPAECREPTMKPTLEQAGNLLVPVDESGTAVGMPEDAIPSRYCPDTALAEGWLLVDVDGCGRIRRIERFDEDPLGRFRTDADAIAWVEARQDVAGHYAEAWAAHNETTPPETRTSQLEHALERLAREARMFRDHGHGREHLTNAILDAQRVLDGGAL